MSFRSALGFATRANLVKPACVIAGPSRVRAISTALQHASSAAAQRPISRSVFRGVARAASTTTTASSASELPPGESVLVASPPREELERDEVDVEALGEDATVRITERAAELRTICTREHDPNVALRVAVDSGGCHGYQYKIELTSLAPDGTAKGDYLFSHPRRQPSHVVVDPVSLTLLKGSTIDFATELIGSSFRIVDNPQANSGCGCGVSWEAKF